jgi:hypothetical protein
MDSDTEFLVFGLDVGTTQCMFTDWEILTWGPVIDTRISQLVQLLLMLHLIPLRSKSMKVDFVRWSVGIPVIMQISRAPTVLEKLPGQTPGRAKIPSVLLYDKQSVSLNSTDSSLIKWLILPSLPHHPRGNCQEKWGSQLSDLSKDEKTKIKTGEWQKVEWFKRQSNMFVLMIASRLIRPSH